MTATIEDRRIETPGPDTLDETACRRLLGTRGVGRLAFTDHALPAVLPLPYAVHEGAVVIPVRRDSDVALASRGSVVAFAVDRIDRRTGAGEGVTVVGPARLVTEPAEVAALDRLRVRGPAGGERGYLVVRLGLVRGWRTPGSHPERADHRGART